VPQECLELADIVLDIKRHLPIAGGRSIADCQLMSETVVASTSDGWTQALGREPLNETAADADRGLLRHGMGRQRN